MSYHLNSSSRILNLHRSSVGLNITCVLVTQRTMYVYIYRAVEVVRVRRRSIYVVQRTDQCTATQTNRYSAKQEIPHKKIVDKKHSMRVTMNISPSVLVTWAVLAYSGVCVSSKNDDLEATVVALSCTLLRFFSSGKNS